MDYKDLVRQCPELGDIFAEIENRLSFLENSLPYYDIEPEHVKGLREKTEKLEPPIKPERYTIE